MEEAESREVQKGLTVLLLLETCVSSPVSVLELAVSKSGFSVHAECSYPLPRTCLESAGMQNMLGSCKKTVLTLWGL